MKFEFVLALLFAAGFLGAQDQDIQISIDAPESVIAGNDMKITVTFNKGDLRDYSRFSQDLPEGFTATNLSSPNADFTFTNQRIRIIWLKLPSDPVVKVVYLVSSDERLSGELKLGGTFAYVNEGERAFIDLPDEKIITIEPNPNIDPSQVVDISDFPNIGEGDSSEPGVDDGPPVEEPEAFAQIIRQKPVVAANGIVTVNLLVRKPEGTNFLKVEEYIPSGYSFEAVEDNGAVVSQSSSIARFVWMRPPQQVIFTLQYRLVPILEQQQGEMLIEGNMTYTESGQSKVASVREMDLGITGLTTAQKISLLDDGEIDGRSVVDAETAGQATGEQGAEEIGQQSQGGDDTGQPSQGGDNATGTEEQPGNQTTQSTNQQETTSSQNTTTAATGQQQTTSPSPGNRSRYESVYVKTRLKKIIKIEPLEDMAGVYYRVQVGAIRKPYFARVVYAEYDILRDVKAEYIDAWHKFTLGSFDSYQEAVDFKQRVLTETPTQSAFIVAYRDGNRVPLNEVL